MERWASPARAAVLALGRHTASGIQLLSTKHCILTVDGSASFFFFFANLSTNNVVLACGKEGNLLHETPSVLLARMVRQQNDPRLFKAGSTATNTPTRKTHRDLPQQPSHQPAGRSTSRVYRLKNMGHPFSSDHAVMAPSLSLSSCQVAACTRPFQLALAAKMAWSRANNACQLVCHHCHLVAPCS